jgi:hypothetical protein
VLLKHLESGPLFIACWFLNSVKMPHSVGHATKKLHSLPPFNQAPVFEGRRRLMVSDLLELLLNFPDLTHIDISDIADDSHYAGCCVNKHGGLNLSSAMRAMNFPRQVVFYICSWMPIDFEAGDGRRRSTRYNPAHPHRFFAQSPVFLRLSFNSPSISLCPYFGETSVYGLMSLTIGNWCLCLFQSPHQSSSSSLTLQEPRWQDPKQRL